MAEDSILNTMQFIELIGKLKLTPRTGWVIRGVPNPESIASHMYRMGIMTFLISDKLNVNKTRCMELALVHDMPECIVGDITPKCGVPTDEKHRREDEAMKQLAQLVGNEGSYLYELYKEYEKQETAEAKMVKELDMFDMIFQAHEYEKKEGIPLNLQEFFDSTKNKFKVPAMQSLVDALNTQREQHFREQKSMELT